MLKELKGRSGFSVVEVMIVTVGEAMACREPVLFDQLFESDSRSILWK